MQNMQKKVDNLTEKQENGMAFKRDNVDTGRSIKKDKDGYKIDQGLFFVYHLLRKWSHAGSIN